MTLTGENTLAELRERIRPYLKENRYAHTLEVEKEAVRLGTIYLPERIPSLRVAALLHDITKAQPYEKQLQICEKYGIILSGSDAASPKVLHAITGAAFAADVFSDVTDEEILGGIRWHTTGRDGMTVFESLIYLADFIEPTRTFEDCAALRKYFRDGLSETYDPLTLTLHLCRTMVYSFDLTIGILLREGERIGTDTVLARNCFLGRIEALTASDT